MAYWHVLSIVVLVLSSGCTGRPAPPETNGTPVVTIPPPTYAYECPAGGTERPASAVCAVDEPRLPTTSTYPGPVAFDPRDPKVAFRVVLANEPKIGGSPLHHMQSRLYRSQDAGVTWQRLALPALDQDQLSPAVDAAYIIEGLYFDATDTLHVVGSRQVGGTMIGSEGEESIFHVTTMDKGVTWAKASFLPSPGFTVLASMAEVEGVSAIFWESQQYEMSYATSLDGGMTWSAIHAWRCYYPSNAVVSEGKILIACLDAATGGASFFQLSPEGKLLEVGTLEFDGGMDGGVLFQLLAFGDGGLALVYSSSGEGGTLAYRTASGWIQVDPTEASELANKDGWTSLPNWTFCGIGVDERSVLHAIVLFERLRQPTILPDYGYIHLALNVEDGRRVQDHYLDVHLQAEGLDEGYASYEPYSGCGSMAFAGDSGVLQVGFLDHVWFTKTTRSD